MDPTRDTRSSEEIYAEATSPEALAEEWANNFDVVTWIKEEMKRELNKAVLVEVTGPAIFGEGNFDLLQNANGCWYIQAKEGWEPRGPDGLLPTVGLEYEIDPLKITRIKREEES